MPITPLPTPAPSRSQTQAAFDAAYAAHIAALPTFVTEANALAALLSAGSGMGAIAIPYTFSTITADIDSGNGFVRFGSATQNAATVIRADLLGSDGLDKTTLLDLFDDSTGAIKGYIRLVHSADPNKYLVFEVSGMASPAGYRNITVVNISFSSASPFLNTDPVVLYFTRIGDIPTSLGNHEVTVHTGNGHGSTDTKIRRFTTALVNTGTAITYADSATAGASFTINDTGIYTIFYSDRRDGPSPSSYFGFSKNSTQLTTSIQSVAITDRAGMTKMAAIGIMTSLSRTMRLVSGDVIRPHTDGTTDITSNEAFFSISKVGSS